MECYHKPHHLLGHLHQCWLQNREESLLDTHMHTDAHTSTHTYTYPHTQIPPTHTHEGRWYLLGGGSRRGLFELLPWVLATEGASEVGEMHVFMYTHKLSCCTYIPHNSHKHSSYTHTVAPKPMVKQAICALTVSLVRTPKQLRDTAINMHLSIVISRSQWMRHQNDNQMYVYRVSYRKMDKGRQYIA